MRLLSLLCLLILSALPVGRVAEGYGGAITGPGVSGL